MTQTTTVDIAAWFADQLPDSWFSGPPTVTTDEDEILVVGSLPAGTDARTFREDTREQRMRIADEAQHTFRRTVSWGVRTADGAEQLFTNLASPVGARLRLRERATLDTLVSAGVARNRSDALAWCVRLVEQHEATWLQDLRDALDHVARARTEGPVSI